MSDSIEDASLSYEELRQRYLSLQQEIERLTAQQNTLWGLLSETARKLQLYSASIKAAVSSLLDYNIFWDSANQHEFLQTINSSVDQVANLVMLMTLALRIEEGNLTLRNEPQTLQEILLKVQDNAAITWRTLTLNIDFPQEGPPVLVDYEYFSLALKLIFAVVDSYSQPALINIHAQEDQAHWLLDLSGFHPSILDLLMDFLSCQKALYIPNRNVNTEDLLRLYVALQIFCLQKIELSLAEKGAERVLRLRVPAQSTSPTAQEAPLPPPYTLPSK